MDSEISQTSEFLAKETKVAFMRGLVATGPFSLGLGFAEVSGGRAGAFMGSF